MKKKIFSIVITAIIFCFAYFLFGLWGIFEINKNHEYLFKTKKNLLFHKKYSEKLHHLRDSNRWGKEENDYLYSVINQNKNFDKTLLIQGDSWAEQISESSPSKSILKKFSNNQNLNTINAGITSFSPSLMHVQYKILKKDFKIIPSNLIIYIDQTDIGDEKCRYLKKKIYSNSGELNFIENEKYSRAIYDYSKTYDYSELYLKSNILNTIIKFPYIKIRQFYLRNKILVGSIITNGWKNSKNYKCGFKQIQKELIFFNEQSKKIFQQSLREYLTFLKKEKKLEKILIITFPHKKHHDKTYSVNVSNYIDDVIRETSDKRISHLNFSKIDFSPELIDRIYQPNDRGSHLKNDYHGNFFIKEILSKLKQ
tara:strand:+ start:746 stop:1849 length:1104 start_codon:yes stop_codon:yes gene_type:complete